MFGSRFSAGAEFDFKKINFVLMRNLEQMNLISLTENELLSIQGGGLFKDIGYAVGYSARMVYEFFTAEWGSLSPSNGYVTAKVG